MIDITRVQWGPVVYALTLTILFGDHLVHATRTWATYRDARSFRNWIIAIAVELGVLTLFLRSLAFYVVPQIGDAVRFLGFVTSGGLVVVGVFLVYSHHRPVR